MKNEENLTCPDDGLIVLLLLKSLKKTNLGNPFFLLEFFT
jgi:hypothetical protein